MLAAEKPILAGTDFPIIRAASLRYQRDSLAPFAQDKEGNAAIPLRQTMAKFLLVSFAKKSPWKKPKKNSRGTLTSLNS